jgi:hypothetical protein
MFAILRIAFYATVVRRLKQIDNDTADGVLFQHPTSRSQRVRQMQGILGYGEGAVLAVRDPNHIQR